MKVLIAGDFENIHVRVIESVGALGIETVPIEVSAEVLDAIERGEFDEVVFVPAEHLPVAEPKGRRKKAAAPPPRRKRPIRFVPLQEERHVQEARQEEQHEDAPPPLPEAS